MIQAAKIRILAPLALALPLLVACGGGGASSIPQTPRIPGTIGSPSPQPSASATPAAPATASFSITVPPNLGTAARTARRPYYVSPNTQSLSIALTAVNGKASTGAPLVVRVGYGQPGCTVQSASPLTCTATMTVPSQSYDTFTVSTYSSQNGSGTALSTTTVTQQFTADQHASVPFTLGGVVASIAMSPSAIHTVQGGGTSSYLVSVTARDASGAVILGNSLQSPISIMIDNDPQHALLVSQTTITAPGTPVQVRYDGSKALADGQIVANAGALGSAKTDVIPLSFTPSSVSAEMGAGAQHISVSEVGFTGQFTATVDDSAIATASVTSTGAGTATVTITPAALGGSSGTAMVTLGDGTRSTSIPVHVAPPSLSGITYYPQDSSKFGPVNMTLAPDGDIYMTNIMGTIGEFNPTTRTTSYYGPLSTLGYGYGSMQGISPDSAGNIWFAYNAFPSGQICEMTVPAHSIACYSSGLQAGASLYGMARGPDGAIWFTDGDYSSPAIGRIDPSTHTITEYTAGLSSSASPYGIVAGNDGNMYFSDTGSTPAFGSISTSTHAIAEYTAGLQPYNPQTQQMSAPYNIALGPDGNIWAADPDMPSIDEFNVSTHQTVQHMNGIQRYGNPWAIATTPGGDLWFTDAPFFAPPLLGDVKIGSITQEYGGFPANATGTIDGIVAASPTDLWFFDQSAHAMAHVTIP